MVAADRRFAVGGPAASLAAVALLAPLPIVKKRGSPRMLAALVLTILPAGGAIALSLR